MITKMNDMFVARRWPPQFQEKKRCRICSVWNPLIRVMDVSSVLHYVYQQQVAKDGGAGCVECSEGVAA